MALRELADGLWVIDHEFSMTGGIQMGLRTSIVRLSGGGLWIHSPGPLSEGERADIHALGPVSALVAPNLFHHFSLLDATRAFPEAQLFAAAGLAEKLGSLPECEELRSEAPALWAGQIEQIVVEGAPRLGEVLFFHPATSTLFMTDLAFNVQRGNLQTRLMMLVNSAWQKLGPSRLARSFMKDRAAVREGIAKALEWKFDRVIVTHGDVVESGGHEGLRAAYTWLLEKS